MDLNIIWEMFMGALSPIIVLLFVAYFMDKYQKEPVKELIKAFAFGMGSIMIATTISSALPLSFIDDAQFLGSGILNAFCNAAIPEELAKFVMLWLCLKNNKYFDEKTDGIIYAAVLSLGFAAIENILYVFNNYENWEVVAFLRAIFSVPGHFCFGMLMGYFYSKVKFSYKPKMIDKVMVLLSPILAHGIYDSLLMEIDNISSTFIVALMYISFLLFVFFLWRHARKKLLEHLNADKEYFDTTTID